MVSKALKRIGIHGDIKAEGEDSITILPDSYVLHFHGVETKCDTIAEIVALLQY